VLIGAQWIGGQFPGRCGVAVACISCSSSAGDPAYAACYYRDALPFLMLCLPLQIQPAGRHPEFCHRRIPESSSAAARIPSPEISL